MTMLEHVGYRPKTEVIIEISEESNLLISEYVRDQHRVLSKYKEETGLWNNNLVMAPCIPAVVGDADLASKLEACYLAYKESYVEDMMHPNDYTFRLPMSFKLHSSIKNSPIVNNAMDFNRLTNNTVWMIFNYDKLVTGILEVYAFCQTRITYDNLITPALEACNFVQTDSNFAAFRGEEILDTLTVTGAINICKRDCVFKYVRAMLPVSYIDNVPMYPRDSKSRFNVDKVLVTRTCPENIKLSDTNFEQHWNLDYVYELTPNTSLHKLTSSTIYSTDNRILDDIYSLLHPDKNLADLDENVSSYLVRWLRDMDQSQGVYTVDKHTGRVTSVLTFILRNDKPICITSIHSTDNSVKYILTLFIKKIAYVHTVKPLLIAVLPAHDQVVKEYFSLGFYASMIRLSRVMYAETFDEILSKRL